MMLNFTLSGKRVSSALLCPRCSQFRVWRLTGLCKPCLREVDSGRAALCWCERCASRPVYEAYPYCEPCAMETMGKRLDSVTSPTLRRAILGANRLLRCPRCRDRLRIEGLCYCNPCYDAVDKMLVFRSKTYG